MQNTVLLLIDWQQAFHNAEFWGPRCNTEAEARAETLIAGCRRQGVPVWHVHHHSVEPNSPLAPHLPGAAPMDFARPQGDEPTFTKSVNSAFIGTNLETELRSAGVSRLIISGVSTDHCVSTSTRMAGNLGFEVFLVGEACFTFDRPRPEGTDMKDAGMKGADIPAAQVHDTHLASLHREFATVVGVAEALKL